MDYSEFPTVRGNLLRFKKYYKIFIELNNKEDRGYLPYPFSSSAILDFDTEAQAILKSDAVTNFSMFQNLVTDNVSYYSNSDLNWLMQNVILCFENESNQELATYLFYITLRSPALEYNSLFYYDRLIKRINKHIKYFSRELETITQINWEPNS